MESGGLRVKNGGCKIKKISASADGGPRSRVFRNLTITPSGRKVFAEEEEQRKKDKKNIPVIYVVIRHQVN